MAVDTKEMLDLYLQAERDVLAGKETMFQGRRLVMADLPQIRDGRQEWERRLAAEHAAARGGRRSYSLASFE